MEGTAEPSRVPTAHASASAARAPIDAAEAAACSEYYFELLWYVGSVEGTGVPPFVPTA